MENNSGGEAPRHSFKDRLGSYFKRKEVNPPPLSPEQKFSETKSFIDGGLDLIKNGKYIDAQKHFADSGFASRIGFNLTPQGEVRSLAINESFVKSDKEARQVCVQLSSFSHFIDERGEIKIGGLDYFDKDLIGKPQERTRKFEEFLTKNPFGVEIAHHRALVSAEEWIHGLQHLKSGNTEAGIYHPSDPEVDVAIYLDRLGVPMTRVFLDTYQRGLEMQKFYTANPDLKP
jgi:hypothetical protein